MALVEFQTGLGRLLREQQNSNPLLGVDLDAHEKKYFESLRETAGFRFCASIQRSWCIGRAAKSAYFTLSLLPHEQREALLNEWVDLGAGTSSFYDSEGEAFLSFISKRLNDPSPELSVCQFEEATLRASRGASLFKPRDPAGLANPNQHLKRGSYASLVRLYADPSLLMQSLQTGKPLPPPSAAPVVLLFSPGHPQLCEEATQEAQALWEALAQPAPLKQLLQVNVHPSFSVSPKLLSTLLAQGTIEHAD